MIYWRDFVFDEVIGPVLDLQEEAESGTSKVPLKQKPTDEKSVMEDANTLNDSKRKSSSSHA